ncbi:MAG: hypothetical protein IKX74_02685 [Erysipelotrichaceae bacterium]|nr:hypothetical protein [Erysipelotrichaceae bacterium]
MKKTLMIIGIILLVTAALCLLAALFFHHMHGSVMDGSAALYARLQNRFLLFLRIGIALGAAGALSLFSSCLLKARR